MRHNRFRMATTLYNLMLAFGAVVAGVVMIRGIGVFDSFPEAWGTKIPIHAWGIIGVSGIVIFGFGNMMASIQSFRNSMGMTIIMASLLLAIILIQRILLDEWYLATIQLTIAGIIQLIIGLLPHIYHTRDVAP